MIAIDMQTLNNVYIWTIKCACVFQAYNVISRRINFGNECFRPNFWHWISLKIFIAESLKHNWLHCMFLHLKWFFKVFILEHSIERKRVKNLRGLFFSETEKCDHRIIIFYGLKSIDAYLSWMLDELQFMIQEIPYFEITRVIMFFIFERNIFPKCI